MGEAPQIEPFIDLPGFRVERVLGRGGFAVVLAATRSDGRSVAVKIATRGDATAAAQLKREEKALRAIGPPVTPELFGSAESPDGSPYLVLERLEAPTLAQRLHELSAPMSRAEFIIRAVALCDGVQAVHAAGFTHLDLKPENIFLGPTGVRLIDFGLTRAIGERASESRAFAGTPTYASPEQCEERPDLDVRADVYAIGVLLFQMLTGRPPFVGDSEALRTAHISLRPPRPSQFASGELEFDEVVVRALAKDRSRRFSTVSDLKKALQTASPNSSRVTAEAPTGQASSGRMERRQLPTVFFASSADVGATQESIRSLGGDLAWAARGRYAVVFAGEAQDPVRRAFRAAQELTERKLAVRVLVDIASVGAIRRENRVRYIAPELGSEDRYPDSTDPLGVIAARAVTEALSDLAWETLPGRIDRFVPRAGSADRLSAPTVVQLGAGPLIGRDRVLHDLLSAAKGITSSGPTVATVVAEPGHGKTHLAATLLDDLRIQLPFAESVDVRAREPVPGDPDETLRTLLRYALELPASVQEDVAHARLQHSIGSERAEELWPAVALSLRFKPLDSARLRALAAAPGVLRAMAMRATGEALRARARRRPLCVVIDDAQFADDTALDALEYAALAEAAAPIFICALGRPSFEQSRPTFGERATRRELHHLGPLDPERAAELCQRLLAPAENVPRAAITMLVQRTHAVPLLLVELVRGLKREGLVRKRMRGDTWFLATDELERLPNSPLIEWLAARELGALPADLSAHARLASLLGTEFDSGEIEGIVTELDAEGLGGEFRLDAHVATRRLGAAGVLVTTRAGGCRFRHSLVREAIAKSTPQQQLGPLHRAAARFYRTTRSVPDIRRLPLLAYHAAEAGLNEEAARVYLQLAEDARGRHVYLDAERSYTRALHALQENHAAERLGALRGRGTTRYRLGRYEDALSDLLAARGLAQTLRDPETEADIVLDAATALDWTTNFVRSRELVEEAEKLAGNACRTSLRAKLTLGKGRALLRAGRRAEASEALQEASRLAESVGDEAYETLIISLVLLTLLLPELDRADEAERTSARAIALARERGDRLHLGAALNNRRNMLIARKDVAGACNDLMGFMQIGREMGFITAEYMAEFNLAEVFYQAGDIASALEHGRRAAEIESRHPEIAGQGPLGVLLLARIATYTGRENDARSLLEQIKISQTPHDGSRESRGFPTPNEKVLLDLIDLATRDANRTEWEELLQRSAVDSVEQEPIEVADLYGTWALRRGRMEEGRRAFEEAARRAERIPNIMDARIQKGLAATGGPLK
jgi:tetratricopeptide (TPR) repeat protein